MVLAALVIFGLLGYCSTSESNSMNANNAEEQPKKPPSLQDILANAMRSSVNHGSTKAGLETKTCINCGAPRPADTNLQFCDYCNNPFY